MIFLALRIDLRAFLAWLSFPNLSLASIIFVAPHLLLWRRMIDFKLMSNTYFMEICVFSWYSFFSPLDFVYWVIHSHCRSHFYSENPPLYSPLIINTSISFKSSPLVFSSFNMWKKVTLSYWINYSLHFLMKML